MKPGMGNSFFKMILIALYYNTIFLENLKFLAPTVMPGERL